METNKKIIIVWIVSIILAFGAGFMWSLKKTEPQIKELNVQIENAKKFLPIMPELNSLPGTITKIQGNAVIIKVSDALPDPFKSLPQFRKANVQDTTKIIQHIPKDREVFQQEFNMFQKQMQRIQCANDSLLVEPPSPFIEINISLNDLHLGDLIVAYSSENITFKEAFNASFLLIQK